jgi:hypothetical protein
VKAGRIFSDKTLGVELLQVVDPELNLLEIMSRSSECAIGNLSLCDPFICRIVECNLDYD